MNGVPVAVIGQAFPYTPIANPQAHGAQLELRHPGRRTWQKMVDEVRAKGAQAVVVISHNGMDVDIKMASRVTGIDAILGGHTHDGMPAPMVVKNAKGQTLVTNAGSNSKFLGVLDFDVRGGKVQDFRYKLLPVFANLLAGRSGDAGLHRQGAVRPTRPSSTRSWPCPKACCTAVATSRLVGPAHRGRADGSQGRRSGLLAGLPLGAPPSSAGPRPSPAN